MTNLRTLLNDGEVLVSFIKEDGSERVMRATTNLDLINYQFKTNTHKSNPTPNVLKVWDLDINQWRSIREDRVLDWKVLN